MAKSFECTRADCAFEVRSNDADEIVSMVRNHARDAHGLAMNDDDVRNGMHEVH